MVVVLALDLVFEVFVRFFNANNQLDKCLLKCDRTCQDMPHTGCAGIEPNI